MRHFCSSVAIFLFASGISSAQVPADWDQWVADGLAAEDNSEYKVAEKLLSRACDVSFAQALGPERLSRACLMLSRTQALQRKWRQAADTARNLVGALEEFSEPDAEAMTRALIEAAEADMAQGDRDRAIASIRKAVDLTGKLGPEEAARAFVDLSAFYMPAGNKGSGSDLMDAAIRALAAQPTKETVLYLRTALKVGHGLIAYGRWQNAVDLLSPLIQAGEKRLQIERNHDELWAAYRSVAGTVIFALQSTGNEQDANRLRGLIADWPRQYDMQSPGFTNAMVTQKTNPVLTQGARANRVDGMVLLSIVVGTDGRGHDVQVLKSLPYGLTWEAVRVVREWRFQPAMLNGRAVPVNAQIEVHFRVLN